MTPAQMEEAGIVSPTSDNNEYPNYVGKLAYSRGRHDVYDSAYGGNKIGFLSSREIVYVRSNDDPKRYYIQFLDRGTLRYGYVDKGTIQAPANNWKKPIEEGKIIYHYNGRQPAYGGNKIGFLSSREIVYVRSNDDPKRYYIQFLDRGTLRYGYVDKGTIQAPANNWKKPIEEGKIIYHYNGRQPGTNVATPVGTDVYAVADGKYRSMVCYGVHPVDRSKMLVNYENYVEGDVQGNMGGRQRPFKVIYGNLSDFENGVPDNTTPSYRQQYRGRVNREVVAEFSASAGDRLGGVGKNGWSAEPYLRFEVRTNEYTALDPFEYVVFPGVGY